MENFQTVLSQKTQGPKYVSGSSRLSHSEGLSPGNISDWNLLHYKKDFCVGAYLIILRTFPDPLPSWSPVIATFTAASE